MLDIPIEAALNKEEVESYKEREMKRQKLREADADMEITQEGMENGVPKASAITRDSDEEKVLPKVSNCRQILFENRNFIPRNLFFRLKTLSHFCDHEIKFAAFL